MTPTGSFTRLTKFYLLMVIMAVPVFLSGTPPASAGGKLRASSVFHAAATAGTCMQDEWNLKNATAGKTLNCTAGDVKIAFASNPRDLSGNPKPTCIAGTTFSFVADFHVTTTATARENIGLYFNTAGGANALTGTCSDNIISSPHSSSNANDTVTLGTTQYEELDTALNGDNCGDISTSDNNQIITVEVDNALCQPAAGTNQVALPDCTSWQQPGGAILCSSPLPYWPYVNAAVPGAPSKCNCNNTFTVPITVQSPNISVIKSADQTSLTDPGGTVTYTVQVGNTSNFGSLTLNQICDNAYGNIATVSGFPACPTGTVGSASSTTCALPQSIAQGGSYSCTFAVSMGENPPSVTDIATAKGVGQDGTTSFSSASNSVTVTVNEAPSTATITKSLVATNSGCATVRYGVDVKNTSAADEVLTLSALTDSQYGSISTLHGSVLGSTCGVAATSPGLGTLSGSSGAGVLGAIPVGADYTCQFDAQFCGNLGTVTPPGGAPCNGISSTDTVSATLTGDESEAVTQTPGTLTVDECFSAYSQ